MCSLTGSEGVKIVAVDLQLMAPLPGVLQIHGDITKVGGASRRSTSTCAGNRVYLLFVKSVVNESKCHPPFVTCNKSNMTYKYSVPDFY